MSTSARSAEVEASRTSYYRWRTLDDVALPSLEDDGASPRNDGERARGADRTFLKVVKTEVEPSASLPSMSTVGPSGSLVSPAGPVRDACVSEARRGRGVEDELFHILMQDREKTRSLLSSWGSSSRGRLLRQVRDAGGDAQEMRRAMVRAYREITFDWCTLIDMRPPAKGVVLYGVRMHRPA